MKKLIMLIVCLASCVNLSARLFDRDWAAHYAQRGQWDKASDLLTNLIVENPMQPDLLYDAGVVAFNQKQFEKAHAYFSNAASAEAAPDLLKEKAHFNAGNTCVELKKLEDAIKQYEAVLAINPENQEAKDNLEIVKKMLEQQQKQQQQQNKDKNKDQQDNDESKKQKSDKDKNDQSEGDRGSDDNKQQEERQDDGSDKEGEQSNSEDQRDHENGASDEPQGQQNEDEGESQGGHDEPSEQQEEEQQSGTQDKQQESKSQENESGSSTTAGAQRYDKEVQRILAAVADKDAQANKQMMVVRVQKAAGKYDENQKNY